MPRSRAKSADPASQSRRDESMESMPSTGKRSSHRRTSQTEEPLVIDRIRVNMPLLIGSIVGLVFVGVLVLLLRNHQVQKNAGQSREMAEVAIAQGEIRTGIRHLETLVDYQRSRNATPTELSATLERLGGLLAEHAGSRSDLEAAYRHYEAALRLCPDHTDARAQLADVCLSLGRDRDALDHLQTLVEQRSESASSDELADLWAQQGRCHLALRQFVEAQRAFAAAISTHPATIDPYVSLARLISNAPDAVCSRGRLKGAAVTLTPAVTHLFPKDIRHGKHESTQVIERVLNLMVAQGRPARLALREHAEFLVDLRVPQDEPPREAEVARVRASELLSSRDVDQDGSLSGDESEDLDLPAFADRDRNARIGREEIVALLVTGTRAARLQQAQRSIESAVAAFAQENDSAEQKREEELITTLTSAAEVYLALAEAHQFENSTIARRYVEQAREVAERATKLDERSAQTRLMLAQLELRSLSFEQRQAGIEQRLLAAESQLRSALSDLSDSDYGADRSTDRSDPVASESVVGASDFAAGGGNASGDSSKIDDEKDRLWNDVEWMLADVLVSKVQASEKHRGGLQEIRETLIPNLTAREAPASLIHFIKARLHLVDREWKRAEDLLRQSATSLSDNNDLARRIGLLRAECGNRMGNPDAQLDHAVALVHEDPYWSPGRLALAQARLNAGHLDEAIEAYTLVANQPEQTETFIRLLLQQESRKLATDRYWRRIDDALRMLAQQDVNKSVYPVVQAEVIFWKAFTTQSIDVAAGESNVSEAVVAQLDEAEAILTEAAQEFPADVGVRVAMADLQLRRFDRLLAERIAGCQQVLQSAIVEVGDDVSLRLSAAKAASLMPAELALPSLADLDRENPDFSVDERAELLRGLARAHQAIGERSAAIDEYVEAARILPDDLKAPLAALQLLVQNLIDTQGDLQEYATTWDDMLSAIRSVEGDDGPYSNYYDATRTILTAARNPGGATNLDRARQQLREAQQERPRWAAISRMLGELATIEGDREVAVSHLEDAIALGDHGETVVGRVIEFYLNQDREEEAKHLLDSVANKEASKLTGRLAQLAWTIGRRLEDNSITLGVLREQARDTDDAAAKILAAFDFLARNESGPQVEKLLKEACELEPQSPRSWLAIVNYYTRIYRHDLAIQSMADADRHLPDDPPSLKPLALARCHEMLRSRDAGQRQRDLSRAEQYYLDAVSATPGNIGLQVQLADFYSRANLTDKARRAIDQILAADSGASDATRSWARRRRALVMASAEGVDESSAALDQLKQFDSLNDTDRLANLRAQLAIYTARSRPSDRADVLALLQELHEQTHHQLTVREELQRAALLGTMGQWADAQQAYRDLLEQSPEGPDAIAYLTLALLSHADDEDSGLEEARALLDRLESLEPNTYRTRALIARWQARSGQPDQAARDLTQFVMKYAIVFDEASQQRIAEADNAKSAITMLSAESSDDPTFTKGLQQANALVAAGQQADALSLVKQLSGSLRTVNSLRCDTLKAAGDLLVEFHQRDAAEKLYAVYGQRSPKPEAPLELARFLGREGRWKEAIDVCRQQWDRLPAETIGQLVVSILRRNGVNDSAVIAPFSRMIGESVEQANSSSAKVARLFALADLRDLEQDYEAAAVAFGEILREDANDVVATNNLAFLWARRQINVDAALELVDHQLVRHQNSAELLDTKAVVLLAAGQPEEAVSLLATVVKQVPLAGYFAHLAEAYEANGQHAAAIEALTQAQQAGLDVSALHPLDRKAIEELNLQ